MANYALNDLLTTYQKNARVQPYIGPPRGLNPSSSVATAYIAQRIDPGEDDDEDDEGEPELGIAIVNNVNSAGAVSEDAKADAVASPALNLAQSPMPETYEERRCRINMETSVQAARVGSFGG